jgi:hypothetical protein
VVALPQAAKLLVREVRTEGEGSQCGQSLSFPRKIRDCPGFVLTSSSWSSTLSFSLCPQLPFFRVHLSSNCWYVPDLASLIGRGSQEACVVGRPADSVDTSVVSIVELFLDIEGLSVVEDNLLVGTNGYSVNSIGRKPYTGNKTVVFLQEC